VRSDRAAPDPLSFNHRKEQQMLPDPLRALRRLALPMTVVAALAATVPAAAHAADRAAPATACLRDFTVHSTEDVGWDGDEPYLKINNATVPAWSAPGSMDDGATAAVYINVSTGSVISAYDEDSPDADDFIGSDAVETTSGTLDLKGDGAEYTLTYTIGACP
jgi:hypothetical protein